MPQLPNQPFRRLITAIVESAQDAEPRMLLLGTFCFFGFPLYYVIWAFVLPQPYESLGLRIAGMVVTVPGLLVRHWPPAARRLLPLYWYSATIYCAPFFFTFMLLQNGVNEVWSGSFAIMLSLIMMMFGVANALVILFIGIVLAFLAFAAVATGAVPWVPLLQQLPVYLFALSVIAVFNLHMAREHRARIEAATAFGGHIAHELRTPLTTIDAIAGVIGSRMDRLLPDSSSDTHGPTTPTLHDEDRRLIQGAPEAIARQVEYSHMIIDLALANAGVKSFQESDTEHLDILEAVETAIARYPFKRPSQRDWLRVNDGQRFTVRAVPILIDHIIFNIVKNAIWAIQAAGRRDAGKIQVRAESGAHLNWLYIRDNGEGIPAAVLSRIFDPFFTTRENGTGLGLHYCRTTMRRFGGDMHCRSVRGEYTEFILEFPVP